MSLQLQRRNLHSTETTAQRARRIIQAIDTQQQQWWCRRYVYFHRLCIPSAYHNVPLHSASFGNPIAWIAEKLTPGIRETQPSDDTAVTRRPADAKETRSVFEAARKKPQAVAAKAKKGATEVCATVLHFICVTSTSHLFASTNIRRPISRFRLASSTC